MGPLSICMENPVVLVINQMEQTFPLNFFGKKGIPSEVFTGKSLYHLLRPTSTMLLDEIRGFFQPCLLLQIVEPRLSQKKTVNYT